MGFDLIMRARQGRRMALGALRRDRAAMALVQERERPARLTRRAAMRFMERHDHSGLRLI